MDVAGQAEAGSLKPEQQVSQTAEQDMQGQSFPLSRYPRHPSPGDALKVSLTHLLKTVQLAEHHEERGHRAHWRASLCLPSLPIGDGLSPQASRSQEIY